MKKAIWSLISLLTVLSFAGAAFADNLAPLQQQTISVGTVLADSNGMTVYVFDNDANGVSSCYDACAKAWPPVLAPAGTTVSAPVGTTTRNDGSLQLTYQGRPVYLYAGDGAIGDTTGDGLGGIWHIVKLQN